MASSEKKNIWVKSILDVINPASGFTSSVGKKVVDYISKYMKNKKKQNRVFELGDDVDNISKSERLKKERERNDAARNSSTWHMRKDPNEYKINKS